MEVFVYLKSKVKYLMTTLEKNYHIYNIYSIILEDKEYNGYEFFKERLPEKYFKIIGEVTDGKIIVDCWIYLTENYLNFLIKKFKLGILGMSDNEIEVYVCDSPKKTINSSDNMLTLALIDIKEIYNDETEIYIFGLTHIEDYD